MKLLKLLCATIIVSATTSAFAVPDISGNWKCTGFDPVEKKNFSTSGEIQKTGDTYSLANWKNDETNENMSGTGMHYDKLKNSFAIVFWSEKRADYVGFGIYQIQSKDKIVGNWALRNEQKSAPEVCERVKA